MHSENQVITENIGANQNIQNFEDNQQTTEEQYKDKKSNNEINDTANETKAIENELKEINNPQTKTTRQQMLNERKLKSKVKASSKLQTKSKRESALVADSVETKLLKKKIIEEELALLKAKNKIPVKTKRIVRDKENEEKPTLKPEVKESLNQHIEDLKNKNTYIERREEQKYKEEMRKKEASEFIKKLKLEKRVREKSRKVHIIDDEYIGRLEDMMEQRKMMEEQEKEIRRREIKAKINKLKEDRQKSK